MSKFLGFLRYFVFSCIPSFSVVLFLLFSIKFLSVLFLKSFQFIFQKSSTVLNKRSQAAVTTLCHDNGFLIMRIKLMNSVSQFPYKSDFLFQSFWFLDFTHSAWSWNKLLEPPHDKTKKWHVRPAKTQISLGIHPVWSVFAVHSVGS